MDTQSASPLVFPHGSHVQDVRELVARVAELERCQRDEDINGFLALFAPGAVWVTGGGRRLIGLDVIGEFTRSVLPGAMSTGSVRYDVENIAFIRPDVALTGVRQEYLDLAGRPLEPPSIGSPSYIWSKTGADWLIVAGQNTGVLPDH